MKTNAERKYIYAKTYWIVLYLKYSAHVMNIPLLYKKIIILVTKDLEKIESRGILQYSINIPATEASSGSFGKGKLDSNIYSEFGTVCLRSDLLVE